MRQTGQTLWLPWFLAPLRGEGFIGRLRARELAAWGLSANPEQRTLEQTLFAALHTPDAPGALQLGEDPPGATADPPTGSGARRTGTPWPTLPRTAGGLGEHGVPVARAHIVETARRTCLVSRRFDRHGPHGRSHVVPLHAVHYALVPGPRQHWAATCSALVQQRRLPAEAAAQARALLHFGRLIGNNDMHFGNPSLHVAWADLAHGRFTLAPVYDMLPMRWRPDTQSGEPEFRALAAVMAQRLAA